MVASITLMINVKNTFEDNQVETLDCLLILSYNDKKGVYYMDFNIIIYMIKSIGINLGFTVCYTKILNKQASSINTIQKMLILFFCICICILQCILSNYTTIFFVLLPFVFIYSIVYSAIFKTNMPESITISIISISLSCIFFLFSVLLSSILYASICTINSYILAQYKQQLYLAFTVIVSIFNIVFTLLFFRIRKLKYGFTFLKNEYIKLQILILTIIIIVLYSFGRDFSKQDLFFTFICISIISLIIIKQVFNLYQKQKLQLQTLKDYEKELSDIKEELRITKEEKEKIIKSNHEFYHRQEALKNKLNTLLNNNYSTEMSNELTNITSRINNLSSEYEDKLKSSPKIDTCGIEEIDDMLTYFQNECNNNNIEFICKFDGNINKIINNVITLSQFETLLGDLIRNSIIAINHTSNENRNIMLVFGLKNEAYELDIYDSGVNFEIETLLKLGLEKCSTHLNEGGTGIGFITTFETLQNTKSSLIITEMNSGNYSKCIGIRFDGNSNYIIDSYRIDSIKAQNITSRKIMFQNSNK